jgi:chitinase
LRIHLTSTPSLDNNNCGADQYGKSAFNFATWDNWARTKSPNPEIKVYIGVAAAAKAAEWGYVDADRLATIIKGLAKYKSFGGVMMWDASEAACKPFSVSLSFGVVTEREVCHYSQ